METKKYVITIYDDCNALVKARGLQIIIMRPDRFRRWKVRVLQNGTYIYDGWWPSMSGSKIMAFIAHVMETLDYL